MLDHLSTVVTGKRHVLEPSHMWSDTKRALSKEPEASPGVPETHDMTGPSTKLSNPHLEDTSC